MRNNYFISSIEKLEDCNCGYYSYYDFGDVSILGCLETKEEAVKSLDRPEITVNIPDYIIIEEIPTGLNVQVANRWWYYWDEATQSYREMEPPEGTNKYCLTMIGADD
jgi:hypothetical protein